MRVAEHWTRLSREKVESLGLEILKPKLDVILCHLLLGEPALAGVWISEISFQPQPFCDSVIWDLQD